MSSAIPDALQREIFDETRAMGWDPHDQNSLSEELMHIVSEVAEAFEEIRLGYTTMEIRYDLDGKPHGVPIELADILIGLFYNAEREGFSLWDALYVKRKWNRERRYDTEGRQLHP